MASEDEKEKSSQGRNMDTSAGSARQTIITRPGKV